MLTENLIGLIVLVALLIWLIYSLFYWNNLAWRLPDKLREQTINKAKHLPNGFPLRQVVLRNAKTQSVWLVRLITILADVIFILLLLVSLYAIVPTTMGLK